MTKDEDADSEQFTFVHPLRLASTETALGWEVIDELGLEAVVDDAEYCADVRGVGQHLNDRASSVRGAVAHSVLEAFALVGSVSESLIVCVGCSVEFEALRRSLDETDRSFRETEICRRFFSIAGSHELLGVGHRLANIAVRALFASGEGLMARAKGSLVSWTDAYEPFGNDRAQWLSLNRSTARELGAVASLSSHSSLRFLGQAVRDLAESTVWTRLDDLRGEVFHRARPESSSLAGLDLGSGFATPINDADGRQIGASYGRWNRYVGGDGREELEAQVLADALPVVSASARNAARALAAAVEPITRGWQRITDQDGALTHVRPFFSNKWNPAACTCCTVTELSTDGAEPRGLD